MTESLPDAAVIRVSRGTFHPQRLAEVEAMNRGVAEYLIPAVGPLSGLIHFYSGVSPEGSIVNISVWDSHDHATQLDTLTEMVVTARREAEAAGVEFAPIVTYPAGWTI